ncbi:MAG: T9SS type A sorting domain-containing protein [Bacteroidota bacterium]
MKKITAKAFLLLSFLGLASLASAQTLPSPYDLSSGDYSFTNWDSLSPAGSYPANMIFHMLGANPTDTANPTWDYTCVYFAGSGTRISGRNADGVAFKYTSTNIGSSPNFSPTCLSLPSSNSQSYVGDACLALNTTGRQNITVSWKGRMLESFNYSANQSRRHAIKMQYSLNGLNGFTNLPDNSFNSGINTYRPIFDSATFVATLPALCENLPAVYIRWIYCQDTAGSGQRVRLGLDDILVTSSLLTGMPVTKSNASWQAYPNPNNGELLQFSQTLPMVQIFSASGSKVAQASNTRSMSLQGMSPGLYLLVDQNGASRRLVIR